MLLQPSASRIIPTSTARSVQSCSRVIDLSIAWEEKAMPVAPLRLIRRSFEFAPQQEYLSVPLETRGIYVLYRRRRLPRDSSQSGRFDVVYIGLADRSVRRRLQNHIRHKGSEWTHFSVYEVWDNIRRDEIAELEGILRHIYRFDFHANRLNLAKGYKKLGDVRRQAARERWMQEATSDMPRQRSRS
jgi:hypothetical protein